ncbi:MAG: glycoside hydrolase family protein [Magnetococcales bacterium]|nr:glycoside hydrolase family protein [Magnetococcales bacterium]
MALEPVCTHDLAPIELQLVRHEGLRLYPYNDTTGHQTIGVGRNLTDVGISEAEAYVLLRNDIAKVRAGLMADYRFFATLDEVRQRVLIDMAFNLGRKGLGTFQNFLRAVARGDYADAAQEMLKSRWADQVGKRAHTLSAMMESGEVPADAFPVIAWPGC